MVETPGGAGVGRRQFLGMLGATAVGGLVPACGPAGSTAGATVDGSPGPPIRIGYLTQATGGRAAYGGADRFVVDAMRRHFARSPLTVGGRAHPVEIVDRDSQSSPDRAADLADDLITNGDIALMLVSATAQTAVPVSDRCEAGGMPCLSTGALWQPWYRGRGGRRDRPFRWTYHFFPGLDDVQAVYADMWDRADTDRRCAGLWPDDPDGRAWADPTSGFPAALASHGYTFLDVQPYPSGSTGFTGLLDTLAAAGPDVLVGVPDAAEFAAFWRQAARRGFQPKIATIGRALAFPAGVEALGELGLNLGTEVWWSPQHPFTSSLTGQSARQLADEFTTATGRQWIQPLGFAHALFEVLARAFAAVTATDDRAGLAAALSRLKLDTVVGPLDWTAGPVPNVATTPLVGGQWRRGTSSPFELVIVSNRHSPGIPAAGRVAVLGRG